MVVRKHISFGALLLLLAALAAAPLFAVFVQTFFRDGSFSLDTFLATLQHGRVLSTMRHSFLLGLYVIAATTCIALPLALIRTKTRLAKHDWLDLVFTIPFMTPPYIGSMGWILFMQNNGYYEQLFATAAPSSFFSIAGMVFIMSMHLYPFLYLMLKNALVRMNGSFQDAALVYGANPISNWVRVVLPLLLSSYVMAALLIFIKTLAEFGTPATFGKRIGYPVFTTEIHQYLSRWPVDIPAATSLSFVLLGVCMAVWYMQSFVSQKFAYGIHSGKSSMQTRQVKSFPITVCAYLFTGVILLLSIGIPYFSIVATSLLNVRGDGLSWSNLTFSHYVELFSFQSSGYHAFMNSVGFAFAAASIASLLGFFTALYVKNASSKRQKLIDLTSLLPNIVPGIVFVVGLILFWNASWLPATVYNTKWMPILTYIVLFLPYSVQYTKAALSQLDQSIDHANSIYGPTAASILVRVWLPLLAQGVLAGWIMTFIISMRELVGSLLILPPSVQTGATFIYSQFEQGNVSLGMAMAVVTVLMTVVFLYVVEWLQRKALVKQHG